MHNEQIRCLNITQSINLVNDIKKRNSLIKDFETYNEKLYLKKLIEEDMRAEYKEKKTRTKKPKRKSRKTKKT